MILFPDEVRVWMAQRREQSDRYVEWLPANGRAALERLATMNETVIWFLNDHFHDTDIF